MYVTLRWDSRHAFLKVLIRRMTYDVQHVDAKGNMGSAFRDAKNLRVLIGEKGQI